MLNKPLSILFWCATGGTYYHLLDEIGQRIVGELLYYYDIEMSLFCEAKMDFQSIIQEIRHGEHFYETFSVESVTRFDLYSIIREFVICTKHSVTLPGQIFRFRKKKLDSYSIIIKEKVFIYKYIFPT